MLLLDSKSWMIDGISVFPDHADPLQFYYMPLAPRLTVRTDELGGSAPQFSLIRFKGEAGTGGFLNFDVNLGLDDDKLGSLKSAIEREANLRGEARLAPVPLIDGNVRLLMLDADSGAAPTAEHGEAPPPTALHFVEQINHAAKPSLYGDNQAAFSVQLTQEGVSAVLQSLDDVILPIAVVYSLQYLGLRPAYSVRLDIDWGRVQKHMDESFKIDTLLFSSDIEKAIDELVDDRAIVFEADSFIAEDEEEGTIAGRRDAAIAQVRAMITDAFFEPSLPPWKPDEGSNWTQDLKKAADVMSLIAAGPAAGATNRPLFSYKKTDYQRTDRKSLNVNFSERTTVKRSIFPQGHLAGILETLGDAGVDRSRFFTEVDLDDPWFERRRLAITARTDFATDNIGAIDVRARYGGQPKNAILTKESPSAEFSWASQLDGNTMHMPVELDFEVAFQDIDTTERPRTVSSAQTIIDGEEAALDPRALYAISTVPIIAVNMPFDRYPMVEAHVRYTDEANQLAQADVFRLTADASEAHWMIFILDRAMRRFDYKLIYRGADHVDHETDWVTTEDEQISVLDPFPRKRELTILAALDWASADRCFVDLRYRDEATGLDESHSVEFIEGDRSKTVSFEMQDPTRRIVEYSATILNKDGSTTDIPASETADARITISAETKGHKLVVVKPPSDFAAERLVKVTAELRFEDFAAGLSIHGAFEFEPGSASKTFEFDYVDPARARYEARTSYLFDNGMKKVVDWQVKDVSVLQLAPP